MGIISENRFLSVGEMAGNAQHILDYLTAKGWTKNAVCGMLGNMQSESTINPGIWQDLRPWGDTYGHGFGLVQWTPYNKITDWMSASGYDIGDINGQLERILWEVANNQQWIATSSYPMSFSDFTRSGDTPYNLAMAFIANYERPAVSYQPIRGEQAEYWSQTLAASSQVIDAAVDWAVGIANDDSHGYDQGSRWGPDYDCASLLIQAWENAGVPVKSNGATYTGNMYGVFIGCGFQDVTGSGLIKGDVLLNVANHTAMHIGNGQIVEASSNEFGGITGGQVGDQTGGEIHTGGYYNFPWDYILRYPGGGSVPKKVSLVRWIPG